MTSTLPTLIGPQWAPLPHDPPPHLGGSSRADLEIIVTALPCTYSLYHLVYFSLRLCIFTGQSYSSRLSLVLGIHEGP